jgi:hypothetical protein
VGRDRLDFGPEMGRAGTHNRPTNMGKYTNATRTLRLDAVWCFSCASVF